MYRRNGYDSRRGLRKTPRLEVAVFQENIPDDNIEFAGRVNIADYDPNDPYSCVCYPKPSSILIPSMVYDEIRCPHPEKHHLQPAQDDVFAYPWTVQTFEPPTNMCRKPSLASPLPIRKQRKPATAKTAPPFFDQPDAKAPRSTPPYSAPTRPANIPKLNLKQQDQRTKISATPELSIITEDMLYQPKRNREPLPYEQEDQPEITQFDSVSQVYMPKPSPNTFRYPSRNNVRKTPVHDPRVRKLAPRTREIISRDLPTRHNFFGQTRDSCREPHYAYSPPNKAGETPQPRAGTSSILGQPNRLFTGSYLDPRMYLYIVQ